MRLLGILSLVVLLAACGKDSKNDSNQIAQVPAYGAGQTCVQNGGYGCSYGNHPPGWQPYPTQNGYYVGYNYGCGSYQTCGYSYSGYNYYSACPYGTVAAYSPYYGLGCVAVTQQPQYYYNFSLNYYAYYSYSGYYALTYCTPTLTACGVGQICQTAGGAVYGFCTYRY